MNAEGILARPQKHPFQTHAFNAHKMDFGFFGVPLYAAHLLKEISVSLS